MENTSPNTPPSVQSLKDKHRRYIGGRQGREGKRGREKGREAERRRAKGREEEST